MILTLMLFGFYCARSSTVGFVFLVSSDVDLRAVSEQCVGLSGSDAREVCRLAALGRYSSFTTASTDDHLYVVTSLVGNALSFPHHLV